MQHTPMPRAPRVTLISISLRNVFLLLKLDMWEKKGIIRMNEIDRKTYAALVDAVRIRSSSNTSFNSKLFVGPST